MTRISCIKAGTDNHYRGSELLPGSRGGGNAQLSGASNFWLTSVYQSLQVETYFQKFRIFFSNFNLSIDLWVCANCQQSLSVLTLDVIGRVQILITPTTRVPKMEKRNKSIV